MHTLTNMKPRAIAPLLLTTWTFLAMPALCGAGILKHTCDCEQHACCEPSTHCGQEPGGCPHEGDCSDDPCNRVTIRAERLTEVMVSLFPTATVPIFSTASVITDLNTVSFQTHNSTATVTEVARPTIILPLLI